MSLISFTKAMGVGTQVASVTKDVKDGMTAAGYSAWVQSITGSTPSVTNLGNDRAKLSLSPTQSQQMRSWVESSIISSVTADPSKKKNLEIDFANVLKPSGLKFGIVAASALIGLGFLGRGMVDNL